MSQFNMVDKSHYLSLYLSVVLLFLQCSLLLQRFSSSSLGSYHELNV